MGAMAVALLITLVLSVGIGAVKISPLQVISIFGARFGIEPLTAFEIQQAAVLEAIRTPRVLLGALLGGALATAGAALQGLYRNPLADPGLLGISSGASLFAAAAVVLNINWFGIFTLPIAAFIGSLLALSIVYNLSKSQGHTRMTTLLLAGIAINAMCGALTGFFTYISTDEQLRSITFWQLGSLGGASWTSLAASSPFLLITIFGIPFFAKALNALLLGENNARFLGIHVEHAKRALITLVALGVGAGVAVAGMIGFVGLVIPHLVRLSLGPDHRHLIPISALLGATLLVLADLLSRTIVQPAELPIGIVTASVGSPFFLYLLLRDRKNVAL
jgi:iron complex transport system permease protein